MHQVHRPSSRLSGAQFESHLLFRSSFLSFAHNFHSRQTYSTLLLKKKHKEAENRQLRREKCRAAELTRSRLRLGIVDARCRMDFEEIEHVGEENDEVLRQAPKNDERLVMQIARAGTTHPRMYVTSSGSMWNAEYGRCFCEKFWTRRTLKMESSTVGR